jgi:hypothetical protein
MIFSIGNNEYVVRFHTKKVDLGEKTESGKTVLTPVSTKCSIERDTDFVSAGYAKCHPNDNFNSETGRQIALKNALEDGNLPKEDRTIFWETYRNWGKVRF